MEIFLYFLPYMILITGSATESDSLVKILFKPYADSSTSPLAICWPGHGKKDPHIAFTESPLPSEENCTYYCTSSEKQQNQITHLSPLKEFSSHCQEEIFPVMFREDWTGKPDCFNKEYSVVGFVVRDPSKNHLLKRIKSAMEIPYPGQSKANVGFAIFSFCVLPEAPEDSKVRISHVKYELESSTSSSSNRNRIYDTISISDEEMMRFPWYEELRDEEREKILGKSETFYAVDLIAHDYLNIENWHYTFLLAVLPQWEDTFFSWIHLETKIRKLSDHLDETITVSSGMKGLLKFANGDTFYLIYKTKEIIVPLFLWILLQNREGHQMLFLLPNYPRHPAFLKHFTEPEKPCESVCKRNGWKDLPKSCYCCDNGKFLLHYLSRDVPYHVWKNPYGSESEYTGLKVLIEVNEKYPVLAHLNGYQKSKVKYFCQSTKVYLEGPEILINMQRENPRIGSNLILEAFTKPECKFQIKILGEYYKAEGNEYLFYGFYIKHKSISKLPFSELHAETTDFSKLYTGIRRNIYPSQVAFFILYSSRKEPKKPPVYAYNISKEDAINFGDEFSCNGCSNEDNWQCECYENANMEAIFSQDNQDKQFGLIFPDEERLSRFYDYVVEKGYLRRTYLVPSKHLLYESRGTVCGNCSVIAVWEDIYENQLRKVENAIYELAQNTSGNGITILTGYLEDLKTFTGETVSLTYAEERTVSVPVPALIWNTVISNETGKALVVTIINNPFQNSINPSFRNLFQEVDPICTKDCKMLGLPVDNETIGDQLIYCCSAQELEDHEYFGGILPKGKYQNFSSAIPAVAITIREKEMTMNLGVFPEFEKNETSDDKTVLYFCASPQNLQISSAGSILGTVGDHGNQMFCNYPVQLWREKLDGFTEGQHFHSGIRYSVRVFHEFTVSDSIPPIPTNRPYSVGLNKDFPKTNGFPFELYYSYKNEANHQFFQYKLFTSIVRNYNEIYPSGLKSLRENDYRHYKIYLPQISQSYREADSGYKFGRTVSLVPNAHLLFKGHQSIRDDFSTVLMFEETYERYILRVDHAILDLLELYIAEESVAVYSGALGELKYADRTPIIVNTDEGMLSVPVLSWKIIVSPEQKKGIIVIVFNVPEGKHRNQYQKIGSVCKEDCTTLGLPLMKEADDQQFLGCCKLTVDLFPDIDMRVVNTDMDSYQSFNPAIPAIQVQMIYESETMNLALPILPEEKLYGKLHYLCATNYAAPEANIVNLKDQKVLKDIGLMKSRQSFCKSYAVIVREKCASQNNEQDTQSCSLYGLYINHEFSSLISVTKTGHNANILNPQYMDPESDETTVTNNIYRAVRKQNYPSTVSFIKFYKSFDHKGAPDYFEYELSAHITQRYNDLDFTFKEEQQHYTCSWMKKFDEILKKESRGKILQEYFQTRERILIFQKFISKTLNESQLVKKIFLVPESHLLFNGREGVIGNCTYIPVFEGIDKYVMDVESSILHFTKLLNVNETVTIYSGVSGVLKLKSKPRSEWNMPAILWKIIARHERKKALIIIIQNNPFQHESDANSFKNVKNVCPRKCNDYLKLTISQSDVVSCCAPDDVEWSKIVNVGTVTEQILKKYRLTHRFIDPENL